MSAIITDDFRRNQARLLVNDIKASAHSNLDSPNALDSPSIVPAWPYRENNNYAIGFGKSDPWPDNAGSISEDSATFAVQAPQGTQQENDDIVRNLFTLKEIATDGVAQLISANPWTSGRKYKAYDPTDNDAFYKTGDEYPCYVTSVNNIYLCLSNTALSTLTSTPPSTTAPTGALYNIERESDGYVWAHVAKVPTSGTIAKLKTGQFTPILNDIDLSSAISTAEQNYTGGLLSYIGVTDGGTGYSSAPTVTLTLVGDTDDSPSAPGTIVAHEHVIRAKAILDGTSVARIELQDKAGFDGSDTGSLSYWDTSGNIFKNIRSATVKITGGSGSGAKAFARIAPHNGYAKNAISILPTWFVGITTDFENTEGGDAPTLSFRQVSLIKDFRRFSDDTSVDTYDALKFITVTTNATEKGRINSLAPGDIIKVAISNESPATDALMYFDHHVDVNGTTKIYYHQNSNDDVNTLDPIVTSSSVLFESAATTSSLTQDDQLGSAITALTQGEYRHLDSPPNNTATGAVENTGMEEFNGEVIFHENRRPFTRGASQTEEVKLIIQL